MLRRRQGASRRHVGRRAALGSRLLAAVVRKKLGLCSRLRRPAMLGFTALWFRTAFMTAHPAGPFHRRIASARSVPCAPIANGVCPPLRDEAVKGFARLGPKQRIADPISARRHQARRLALPPVHLKLSRCRRSAGRARGRRMYMWHAVDAEGEVLEILVQPRRDQAAALRLIRKLLRRQPRRRRSSPTN
jgi:hypothetical protein